MMDVKKIIPTLLYMALKNKYLRKSLLKKVENMIYKERVLNSNTTLPKVIEMERFYILRAMLYSAFRAIEKGYFSPKVASRIAKNLVEGALLKSEKEKMEKYEEKYGEYPPAFITLSPTKVCNLRCKGCYAASEATSKDTLPYNLVEKILDDIRENWGVHFTVISGGEPFMYRSEGKTLLDIFDKYRDIFFLVYTNGTLIDRAIAKLLAEFGNVTPAISVEGFEKETDERRGKGVFKKILRAFDYLKEEGVPLGVSLTATRENAHLFMDDELYDYYFEEIGVTHMWIFQYMPIGRGYNPDLMVTPEQRVKMLKQWRKCMVEKKYFVADFWNSGVVASGCIAYGRDGGYLYIDWNGKIMPCVFVPFYVDTVYDIYSKGKTLTDAIQRPFFKRGREWQRKYGYCRYHKVKINNWFMPCSIRDHYENFVKNIHKGEAKPEDENAAQFIKDDEYFGKMVKYDNELEKLTDPLWEKFLKEGKLD